jgi:hydroxymethylpyrimidine/phosphomethylpyrimidine kinase
VGDVIKRVLTIAGSDPSGGAGIQADLKVFAELGVYGLSVVTDVTAQNSEGVQKLNSVPPRIILAQIDSAVRDIGVDACKIGMLYSPQAVSLVAERIDRRRIPNVVIDPVMCAKDGTRLLLPRAVKRMRRALLSRCKLVTPNLDEARELCGIEVTDIASGKEAAKRIHGFGVDYVLIKGGHLSDEPVDLLYDGENFVEYPGKRVVEKNMHGTGCVLSAAIAARLAHGDTVPEAVKYSKKYVGSAIKNSVRLGKGKLWYFVGGDRL